MVSAPREVTTHFEAEMCAAVIVADVPEQSVRRVRLELNSNLLVVVRTQVLDRKSLQLVLHPRVAVEQEALAGAGRQRRQHGRLAPRLALCRPLEFQFFVDDDVRHCTRCGCVVRATTWRRSATSSTSWKSVTRSDWARAGTCCQNQPRVSSTAHYMILFLWPVSTAIRTKH